MKKVIIILALVLYSCANKPKEINNDPLVIQDTVKLDTWQKGWYTSVDNPSRGKIKVSLDNYSDSAKKFVILVKEVK